MADLRSVYIARFPLFVLYNTQNLTLLAHGLRGSLLMVFLFTSFPQAIGQSLLENLGVDSGGEVDCDTRDSLPSLVISLGGQTNSSPFVLKPRAK